LATGYERRQAEALGERIGPTVGYFFRLFERLETVGSTRRTGCTSSCAAASPEK
jgi:hypothetical protein